MRAFLLGLAVLGLTAGLGSWLVRVEDSPPAKVESAPITEGGALYREPLPAPFEALRSLHAPKSAPQPGEWLAEHEEHGQSVAAYKTSGPVRPTRQRRTLYLQPLGPFTPEEARVIEQTAAFVERFFCVPTTVLEALPLSIVPEDWRRAGRGFGEQLHSSKLLGMLERGRPPDAVAYLALTARDLWPGRGWNFVYGQASLKARVGVWSTRRNGTPGSQVFLRRTIKTAAHELGHILGVHHCTGFECVMNGVNHREESDSRPLGLCPADMAKLTWNTVCDPKDRLRALAELTTRYGLSEDAAAFAAAERALP